jgi:iron complex outermembrane recepter protein
MVKPASTLGWWILNISRKSGFSELRANLKGLLWSGVVGGGIALVASHAHAQSKPAAAAGGGDDQLQEIIVTANKRAEPLSKVPISIQAYTREDLEVSGVKSIADLAELTPGVEFDQSSGFGPGTLNNVSVRGVNSAIGTSTTGIYVDDTPIQSRVTALSYFGNPYPLMFDVDHVEVNRGPQGTLFGAGSEGGALRFISPDPQLNHYTGFVRSEVSFTDHGAPSGELGGAVGGPIVQDTLGFRLSAWGRNDGGYVDRVDPFTGQTVDKNANAIQSFAVRGALAAVPADGFKITPSIYYQSVHREDSSANFEYLSTPSQGAFNNGRLLAQPSTDEFFLPSLKLEADLNKAKLTSVTSYVDRSGKLLQDNTSYYGAAFGYYLSYGNPMGPEYPANYSDAGPTKLTTSLHEFVQEVRLTSAVPDARLVWTAGLFYSHSEQNDKEDTYSAFYATNFFGLPPTTVMYSSSLTSTDSQIAAFGQADYKLTKALTLTAGLRVARTDARFAQAQSGVFSNPEFPYETGGHKETPVTPKVVLSYQVDDGNMLYASAGKGYRIGGANPPIPLKSAANPAGCPLDQQPGPYDSDSVWSYEIGAKDRLFDGRLSLDSSVFHVDWRNIQQSIFISSCGFGYIANTGNAVSNGFDVAARVAAADSLIFGASVAYTDAHITRDVSIFGQPVVQDGDAIGSPPWVTSPWNLTASAEYRFTLRAAHDSYIRLEDIYHSKNPGPFNTQIVGSTGYAPLIPANPSTNQLNLRAGIAWSSFDVALFVNNLTNTHPALGRYQDTVYSQLFTNTTFRPLTAGVTASYRF